MSEIKADDFTTFAKGDCTMHDRNYDVKVEYVEKSKLLRVITKGVCVDLTLGDLSKGTDVIITSAFKDALAKEKEVVGNKIVKDILEILHDDTGKYDDVVEIDNGFSAATQSYWRLEVSPQEGKIFIRPDHTGLETESTVRYVFVEATIKQAVAFWFKNIDDKLIDLTNKVHYDELLAVCVVCTSLEDESKTIHVNDEEITLSKQTGSGKTYITVKKQVGDKIVSKKFTYDAMHYYTYQDYLDILRGVYDSGI